MTWWFLILSGYLAIAAGIVLLWLVQRRTGDPAIVDVGWTCGVAALGVYFCAASIKGDLQRRVLIAILVSAWALRLGGHLLLRVVTMARDGRYVALQQQWQANLTWQMFRFFQIQAVAAVFFALPLLLGARNQSALGPLDFVGIIIWLVGVGGEALADRQLTRFRRDPSNHGQVCQLGLWHYSRHPNYFFEWLHWWSYACFAATAAWGWLSLAAPLAMLYVLLYVTGVPLAEQQAIRSRGDAYREYQRTTNAFFLGPRRRSSVNREEGN